MPQDPLPDKIKAAQETYPTDARAAMDVLLLHYEVEPVESKRRFTNMARKLLHTKHDETQVEDLVSATSVELCEPAVAAKYDPQEGHWVNWGLCRMEWINRGQHRAWVTRQGYAVNAESLAKFETKLRRKVRRYAGLEKGSLSEHQVEPICAALQPLSGQSFTGSEIDGKTQTASKQLNTAMRPLLVKTGIVDENGYGDIVNLLKHCAAVGDVEWPRLADGRYREHHDRKTDAEVFELLSDHRDEVRRRIVDWMEGELLRTEPKLRGPKNAATWFLYHYADGCNGLVFLNVRRTLCERFPKMQELLAAVDGAADLRPDRGEPHHEEPDSAAVPQLFGEHVKKITWEHISLTVFDSDNPHTAKNHYGRRARPSFLEWQEVFGGDGEREHDTAGDSAEEQSDVPRKTATDDGQSQQDSRPVSSITTKTATD